MIYKKLNKLKKAKADTLSLISAAYYSGADPDIVMIRVNDLQHDVTVLDEEIQMEEIFVRLKWGLVCFGIGSLALIIISLFKTY
jgi:hypothetical protein